MRYQVAFLLIFLTASSAASERAPACGDAVDRQLFAVHTWIALAAWYHDHPHCVDGYMAERVTSQIADWLAQDRPTFLGLQAAIAQHAEFELLVNWHLGGEYHGLKTLESIAVNAEYRCPKEAASV